MADASGVRLRIRFDGLPFVSCAQKYAKAWTFPGGASDNRLYYGERVSFAKEIEEHNQMLMFDPQTSGGLLMSVPADAVEQFKARAQSLDQPVWEIGEVIDGSGIEVI